LLKEWHALGGGELPGPLEQLLHGVTGEELDQLSRNGLPQEWLAEALVVALRRPHTQMGAARLLHQGGDELPATAWGPPANWKGTEQSALLDLLMAAGDNKRLALLSRLVEKGCVIRPSALGAFLEERRAYEEKWDSFWLSDHHLLRLLKTLAP